jgi:hypothetical protein
MSTGAIIAIVIAVIVVAAAAVLAVVEMRRKALRDRFGPEYDRLVKEKGTRQAEAELTERQRRFAKLDIRELTPEQRAGYIQQWNAVQARFVDDPAASVRRAGELITAVERVRGYPDDDLDALTLDHAQAVDGYRQAQQVLSSEDDVSTEQLRNAVLAYRSLFSELAGSPAGAIDGSAIDDSRTPASVTVGDRPADDELADEQSASAAQVNATPKE